MPLSSRYKVGVCFVLNLYLDARCEVVWPGSAFPWRVPSFNSIGHVPCGLTSSGLRLPFSQTPSPDRNPTKKPKPWSPKSRRNRCLEKHESRTLHRRRCKSSRGWIWNSCILCCTAFTFLGLRSAVRLLGGGHDALLPACASGCKTCQVLFWHMLAGRGIDR